MKQKLTFLILLFSCQTILAQNQIIFGQVSNETGLPLVGATILFDNNKGTSTDKNGFFISKPKKPIKSITASFVGYHSKKKTIKKTKSDTIFIDFFLEKKAEQIGTITINESKIFKVFNERNYSVIDFEITNDFIYLLTYERGKRKVILLNFNEQRLSTLKLSFDAKELRKDCFGNIHALGKTKVAELSTKEQELFILAENKTEVFEEKLAPCQTIFNNQVFFKKKALFNQHAEYYFIERNTKVLKTLKSIYFNEGYLTAQHKYREIIKAYYGYIQERHKSTVEVANIIELGLWDGKLIRLANAATIGLIGHFQNRYERPIYCPLFNINNKLYLFDHINDTLSVYDSNLNESKIPIQYHHQKGWKRELLWDESSNKIYAKFNKRGIPSFQEIDIETGEATKVHSLNEHTFPEKIIIRNGAVYYIKTTSEREGYGVLFKQLLSEL